MILVLGGTTEGRVAVETLEEAGKPYYYSTLGNTQEVQLHHGMRLSGGMNEVEMLSFCINHGIRLLLDAAHPFAEGLHAVVHQTAQKLHLPVVRLERIYPSYPAHNLCWCNDYEEAIVKLQQAGITRLLALSGVNTLAKLRRYWQDHPSCYFRILEREQSKQIAEQQGFPSDHLVYYQGGNKDAEVMEQIKPQAILLKESGYSGGFPEKVKLAEKLGAQVFVIRRPSLPASFLTVNGPHGLRRSIEKLLPDFYDLHTGLTTGTCATAAMLAAFSHLVSEKEVTEVPVILPNGETIQVASFSQKMCHGESIRNSVVGITYKPAGDDPDITNGIQLRVELTYESLDSLERLPDRTLTIRKESSMLPSARYSHVVDFYFGTGIGRVTLPGLGLEVGSAAVNQTPLSMFDENLTQYILHHSVPNGKYRISLSIPAGEELAKRTFNPRLGVEGGISIIGTSGIVKPFSSEAFVHSIRKALEVAKALNRELVVVNSGAKSEHFLRERFSHLPQQSFVHYGNFIGQTLGLAAELQLPHLVMGLMIGKAVKLAEGHFDTHSKHTVMNKEFVRGVVLESGCGEEVAMQVEQITLARELWNLIPRPCLALFVKRILAYCHQYCDPLLPNGRIDIVLISEEGEIWGDDWNH